MRSGKVTKSALIIACAVMTFIIYCIHPVPAYCAEPLDDFWARSAFIGNSVGDGLALYNEYKEKEPLGDATMLTRVSYSFHADEKGTGKFIPKLNGVPMRAKDAIKECGAEYVFICMGTNDLVGSTSAESAFGQYQAYIEGIIADNPSVTIFIESCPPSRPSSNVNNDKINDFNAYTESYCALFPNMFYLDISSPLKDADGYLASGYCSDGSCHLTNSAYGIWADTVRTFISGFIAAQDVLRAEQAELERVAERAGHDRRMAEMNIQKRKMQEELIEKERQAAAALEEQKKYELLNVPDEVTLMRSINASRSEQKYNNIFSYTVSSR